jgi:SAM-dependent methyltransferase
LDYGCGYGRTCAELMDFGYTDVIGVDISSEMIRSGLFFDAGLNLQQIDGEILPFPDNTFSACTLLSVLTCIPTDIGQQELINSLKIESTWFVKSPLTPLFKRGEIPPFGKGRLGGIFVRMSS